MVVWCPEDAQWWYPRPTRHVPVIIVIFVLVVGITHTSAQVVAMATLLTAVTAAIMRWPVWATGDS
jgi:hypothetical protein